MGIFDLRPATRFDISDQEDSRIWDAAYEKRAGNYDAANKIYIEIYNRFGGSGVLYASWAKTLASAKIYDEAVHLFNLANITCEQVMGVEDSNSKSHMETLMFRNKMTSESFISYMKSISGNPNWK